MIVITPVTRLNISLFKEARLRALQEAPYAFSSTYQQESEFTESEWLSRVDRMNGECGIGFLAIDGENPCGILGCLLHPNDPSRATLISMWTAPTHRKRGVGRMLVNAVVSWARGRTARNLYLMVTSNNASAFRFYERLGFTRTGRTEPYPNDPAVIEYEMSRGI